MKLKHARHPWDEALAQIAWPDLAHLVAEYYRRQGYRVSHSGASGSKAPFEGSIDLRLHRGGEHLLVQCRHWNVEEVQHTEVHQLLGAMLIQRATGAILICQGGFSAQAIQAAEGSSIALIDGTQARDMLESLPEAMLAPLLSQVRAAAWNSYLTPPKAREQTPRQRASRLLLRIVLGWAIGLAMIYGAHQWADARRPVTALATPPRPSSSAALDASVSRTAAGQTTGKVTATPAASDNSGSLPSWQHPPAAAKKRDLAAPQM